MAARDLFRISLSPLALEHQWDDGACISLTLHAPVSFPKTLTLQSITFYLTGLWPVHRGFL
jgi:hypothetical protein